MPKLPPRLHAVPLLLATLATAPSWAAAEAAADLSAPMVRQYREAVTLAERGNSEAQYRVSLYLSLGEGVKVDHYAAVSWLNKAARQHHPAALYDLGRMELVGFADVERNRALGLEHLTESAEMDHLPAIKTLALVYEFGHYGEPADLAASARWWERASRLGDREAQFHFGRMCLDGSAVGFTATQGLVWLENAARQGSDEAIYLLANTYYKGKELRRDYVKAHAFASISLLMIARNGIGRADLSRMEERRTLVDFLTRNMSDTQLKDARRFAADWLRRNPEVRVNPELFSTT